MIVLVYFNSEPYIFVLQRTDTIKVLVYKSRKCVRRNIYSVDILCKWQSSNILLCEASGLLITRIPGNLKTVFPPFSWGRLPEWLLSWLFFVCFDCFVFCGRGNSTQRAEGRGAPPPLLVPQVGALIGTSFRLQSDSQLRCQVVPISNHSRAATMATIN